MQGLEEARKLYERYGVDMIERLFPKWAGRIAVGLVGHGSECFGFDDEISRDHDFPEASASGSMTRPTGQSAFNWAAPTAPCPSRRPPSAAL